jgi:glycosyltransferase involved in cell wall biosynthesis
MSDTNLRVQHHAGAAGFGFRSVAAAAIDAAMIADWIRGADAIFAARAEVASVSIVESTSALLASAALRESPARAGLARAAALPLCFLNGRVAGLLGVPDSTNQPITLEALQAWIERATLKGLVHVWLITDRLPEPLRQSPARTVPAEAAADHVWTSPWRSVPGLPASVSPIALGIDAAWLLGGESGAQVFAFEMARELARREDIERMVFLSESGRVPGPLSGVAKVSGASWADVAAGRVARLDILHRPYQPGADVDYRRYYAAARCVAITVLDFIAYDNPSYHESVDAWRQYRNLFDEQVGVADGVFAISDHVGSRLRSQFAHALAGPVRSVLLGADHLVANAASTRREPPAPFATLGERPFLLVLGNDFEHKNRDFAVRVFADMCERGYDGVLVLAGFHLDLGSSYAHELSSAAPVADRIIRTGPVASDDKTWLLSRAQAVLYPTSSEGFGLIPFEAAALGTPTAFVSFGPLRETLPGVAACGGWEVRAFADHVRALLDDPDAQVEQVRRAATALTWRRCVDDTIAGYRQLLSETAPWQTHRRVLVEPRAWDRIGTQAGEYAYRVRRKLRRIAAERWTGRKP